MFTLPIGIASYFGYDLPLKQRLEMIAESGFTATNLWYGKEEEIVSCGLADEVPSLVSERGLVLDSIHIPFQHVNYIWSTSYHEQAIIRHELLGGISFCGKHHIPIMVMHPVNGETIPPPNRSGLELILPLVEAAEARNVIIALENVSRTGNTYLDYLFSNLQSPNLGFCYDSSHDNIARVFRRKALEKWGHLLVTTHISDNLGLIDDHFLPGKGNINWPEIMKQIPTSYKGVLLLEVDNPQASAVMTPQEFLKQSYQSAITLTGMVR